MKLKSIIIAALIAFAGNVWADTTKLLESDGWTKITTLPSASDIANNYYVFVDNSNDLMLGIGKGVYQNTKWYSLGVYYQTSVEPTSADINGKTWIVDTSGSGFSLTNLEYSAQPMMTEWNAAWKFDTNDVYAPEGNWTVTKWAYNNGSWTIQNGKYPDSGYLGPWDDVITNGAECAANKTGNNVGHFQIYAISRTQFMQNLLDNASDSNPVDLTPWYVTNATFDANNITGWTAEGSGNNFNYDKTGCEIWHRSNFNLYQALTVPNGKFKASIQATGSTSGTVYGTSGGTTKTASATVGNKDNYQNSILEMIKDRNYGRITTDEITVSNSSLTIGFKDETSDQWDVFDNFKLYCIGIDLSAYEDQLNDLVSDCNDFISSDVVPTASETAISDAVTTYDKSYSTAKEYSTAIVALTTVLNTYRNDTELKDAYATYKAMRTNVQGLENTTTYKYTDPGTAKSSFDAAISTANTAVEAATTAETINTQTANIRAAAITFISSVTAEDGNPFNLTFLASTAAADWQTASGLDPAATAPAWSVPKPDASMADFVESYTQAAGGESITGNILYQTLSGMPAGYYTVALYAAASYTPGRGSLVEKCTDGQPNITFGFAGDNSLSLPTVHRITLSAEDQVPVNLSVQLAEAGALTFGIKKTDAGSNWHVAQIYAITYSKDPDLTILKEDRDALVSEAEGLLASADAAMLTSAQREDLQNAIDAANAANTFDALTEVTMTTLPNAIQTARLQIQQAKDNRVLMIAALERFENDYNLADGTDYSRLTMSADAWATLIEKVNDVTEALDDVSLGSEYASRKDALVAQMDATDASLRLFKSYKAMVEGTKALSIPEGTTYDTDGDMASDDTQETAIAALNTAFGNYADSQAGDFNVNAFLGENLDFSAAEGSQLGSVGYIFDIAGWEETYQDVTEWARLRNQCPDEDNKYLGQLFIRTNWTDKAAILTAAKQKMLPEGKYKLSLKWNSNLENMKNLSQFKVDETSTAIGEATDGAQTLEYEFDVTNSAQPFDLVIGFQKKNTGDAAAQIIADDVTLTYIKTISLANNADNSSVIASAVATGRAYNVTLSGRTLFKDDSWNTICLPFSMTAEQVAAQLAPTALMELDTESTELDGETLYLNFKDAIAIEAGKPYIIKWTDGGDIFEPTFTGVTLTSSTPADVDSDDKHVTFKGTYSPVALTKDDNSNLYLTDKNTLDWPNVDNFYIKAFRAYFNLSETAANNARGFVLRFDNDDITDIDLLPSIKNITGEGAYYTIDGQRLSSKPTKSGIYITEGKKVEIK